MIDSKNGIWLDNQQKHWNDNALLDQLLNLFKNKTVYDFGCGNGYYVSKLCAKGIDCLGFDGNPRTQALTHGRCAMLDLTKPINLPSRDWVMSLEVGEHIPPMYETTFIDNLHRHCREGVLLSWAIPGQGGEGHVNERTNAYIINLFNTLGFKEVLELKYTLRNAATLLWFKNTLMVFTH